MYNHLYLVSDGGCLLYKKIAAYAFLIMDDDFEIICQDSQLLSGNEVTSNVAEYSGLINGLQNAAGMSHSITVVSDSQLMISQMNGSFQVKAPHLIELHKKATMLCSTFDEVTFEWRAREDKFISICDKLCDEKIESG